MRARRSCNQAAENLAESLVLVLLALAAGVAAEGPRASSQPETAPAADLPRSNQGPERAMAAANASVEGMVLVPTGTFLMGSSDEDRFCEPDEKPQRVVQLPAFYIDQFEVSNIDYKRFIDETGYRQPQNWTDGRYEDGADFYPVVDVSWWDAAAYARWAGKRLPTEAEWEKAARGTDGRRFPWGDEYRDDVVGTGWGYAPVSAHLDGASPYGVLNMAGNVAEWTASVYAPYPELVAVLPSAFGGVDTLGAASRPRVEKLQPRAAPGIEPASEGWQPEERVQIRDDDPRLAFFDVEELQDTRPRVYRGGSINNFPRFLRCANREHALPKERWYNIGFRCAKDATAGDTKDR